MPRSSDEILEDIRQLERELSTVVDEYEREEIEADLDELEEEYADALYCEDQ